MSSNAPAPANQRQGTGRRTGIVLAAGLILLVAFVTYSAIADLGWLTWILARGWLATLAIIVIALAALFVFDLTRPKNAAWRTLRERFGTDFGESFDRRNFGTGRGQVGDHAYFGLRCFGSPGGLEISRILSFVNPPLYVPWTAMTKIDTFPNLLTGRKEFETDMQARIALRKAPDLDIESIEVPWLAEYRQLLPKSVKYRAIKLSKK